MSSTASSSARRPPRISSTHSISASPASAFGTSNPHDSARRTPDRGVPRPSRRCGTRWADWPRPICPSVCCASRTFAGLEAAWFLVSPPLANAPAFLLLALVVGLVIGPAWAVGIVVAAIATLSAAHRAGVRAGPAASPRDTRRRGRAGVPGVEAARAGPGDAVAAPWAVRVRRHRTPHLTHLPGSPSPRDRQSVTACRSGSSTGVKAGHRGAVSGRTTPASPVT